MHAKLIVVLPIAALVFWRLYARTRRMFGRQRILPRRMIARIAILAVLGLALLFTAVQDPWNLADLLGGAACGALLARLALRHTQFANTPEGSFYTPHTYIGLIVTVAFLGRLFYDVLLFSHGPLPAGTTPGHPPAYPESPLTLAVSAMFLAYYVAFYVGVLRHRGQPENMTAPLEVGPP